jgi:hypothetical protein
MTGGRAVQLFCEAAFFSMDGPPVFRVILAMRWPKTAPPTETHRFLIRKPLAAAAD